MYAILIITALSAPPEFNDGYAFAMKATQLNYQSEKSFSELVEEAGQRASRMTGSDELDDVIRRYASPEAVARAGDSHDYAEHRNRMEATGRLVVLLTRDYCAPCETMKHRLDGMGVDYATVHYGQDPEKAVAIGSRGLTPELVIYDRVGGKWFTRRLEGVQSERRIREFLDERIPTEKVASGEIRLPGPAHALRGTMCGSRGCQMCVGIALRNLGITPNGRDRSMWLNQYDNHYNAGTLSATSRPSPLRGTLGRDDPYGETPREVVSAMLDLVDLQPGELLYDLGSGDGRIAIAAAERGARAIGYEIDAELVDEARESAGSLYVTFEQQDVTEAEFPGADVLACYLTPSVTNRVDFGSLPSGVRIVCHEFPLEDVMPVRTVSTADGRKVYLYETPLRRQRSQAVVTSRPAGCSGGSCGVAGRLFGGLFCRNCR